MLNPCYEQCNRSKAIKYFRIKKLQYLLDDPQLEFNEEVMSDAPALIIASNDRYVQMTMVYGVLNMFTYCIYCLNLVIEYRNNSCRAHLRT